MMPPLRIALATPFADNLSETFIAAHIHGLERVTVVLKGGTLPLRVAGGVDALRKGTLVFTVDRQPVLRAVGCKADLLDT